MNVTSQKTIWKEICGKSQLFMCNASWHFVFHQPVRGSQVWESSCVGRIITARTLPPWHKYASVKHLVQSGVKNQTFQHVVPIIQRLFQMIQSFANVDLHEHSCFFQRTPCGCCNRFSVLMQSLKSQDWGWVPAHLKAMMKPHATSRSLLFPVSLEPSSPTGPFKGSLAACEANCEIGLGQKAGLRISNHKLSVT